MDIKASYDLIVIGGGSGGYAAARTAKSHGLSVAIIDSAEELGGLCILRGCMPTKALLETSNRLRAINEADEFGIQVSPGTLNIDALRSRKERLIDGFKEYRVKALTNGTFPLYRGPAEFVDAHLIKVDTSDGVLFLKAKTFVIATGSEEAIPQIEGLSETPYWTSDDIVDLPRIPDRVVVMGTGAVGMESAFLFQGFGSQVTILSRSRPLLSGMEPDISEAMLQRCEDLGIDIFFEHSLETVAHEGGEFILTLVDKSSQKTHTLKTDAFVVATGRKPRIDSLKLQNAGFEESLKRIEIDQHSQTKCPHIFAAGDCASPLAVVHLAVIQGEVAGKNSASYLRDPQASFESSWNEKLNILGIFTDPEIVQVGLTEETAKDKGHEVISATYRYDDQGKGEIVGEKHGLVKLIADAKTGKILGASGMGPHVIDYSHTMTVAMHQDLTVEEFVSIPSYHPTLGEIWSYVAEDFLDEMNASSFSEEK